MAIRASVTVSMSAEMIGMFSCNPGVRVVWSCVSRGRMSEYRVASVTSSKVRPVPRWLRKKASDVE